MEAILGTSLPVFIGLTVILFGGAAFLMGQALAETWRPRRQNVIYGLLLAAAARFFHFSLFGGELLSITGYLIDAAVIIGLALFAYRATAVRKLVSQYPWLYERDGPLHYREKRAPPAA